MEIFILIGLIILNGLFAMSEIAIVTAKKSRLSTLAAKGSTAAKAALRLGEDPTQFLSTVQIGITSIGIMNGIFGESILAEPFALWLQSMGLSAAISDPLATVLVVVVVTYLSIVVGELVPKRIGQISSETIACIVARPMEWLAVLTKPFVMLLTSSTHTLMRLLGFNQINDHGVTEDDIRAMLLEGSSAGIIEHQEHAMVTNVLRLDERPIASLMVPRSEIIYLDVALPLEENYQRVMQSPHSRFPICDRQMDTVLCVINSKELLAHAISGQTVDLATLAKPCNFMPQSLTGMELLDYFRASHTQMVFVVDEYGGVKGLVTLHDLLEALTGEFESVNSRDAFIVTRDDGSLLLDGLLSVFDLKDCLGMNELPDEGEYQTLNGLIMQVMGKLPMTGEKILLGEWTLEVVDMDGRRIDKVLATRVAPQRSEDDDG
jgi:putative hemolysin